MKTFYYSYFLEHVTSLSIFCYITGNKVPLYKCVQNAISIPIYHINF